MTQGPAYINFLNDELAERCEKNAAYSLRSFAGALKVDAGTLSKIINGKQPLSHKMAQRFLEVLDLAPSEQTQFMASVKPQSAGTQQYVAREYKGADLSVQYYRVIDAIGIT